jgi:hypothetical protein
MVEESWIENKVVYEEVVRKINWNGKHVLEIKNGTYMKMKHVQMIKNGRDVKIRKKEERKNNCEWKVEKAWMGGRSKMNE